MKQKIAIVGTGIAGMACGYFLKDFAHLIFYEKNETPGGHTNTVSVNEDKAVIPIDTGFMVFNQVTYPNLVRFFKQLEIPVKNTSMSFSVQYKPSGLEYCGTGIRGIFAQKRNLLNVSFWKMLGQINRFNHECDQALNSSAYLSHSLGDYIRERGYGDDFRDKYLLPMGSAIWSTETKKMMEFPAMTLIRFFKNHGLLGLNTHYQWKTVAGGSRVYRDKVLGYFPDRVWTSCGVLDVKRDGSRVIVRDALGSSQVYDKVILACHADEALLTLRDASLDERRLLSHFLYQSNRAVLHTDASVMPQTRAAWSSWNTVVAIRGGEVKAHTVYWMNSLQQVSKKKDYFVSINDPGTIDPSTILWEREYQHPVFDFNSIRAQEDLSGLNARGPVYYCGSYFKYGFHEDAFVSALDVCKAIRPGWDWK